MHSLKIGAIASLLVLSSGAIASASLDNQLAWYKWIKLGMTRQQVQGQMGEATSCTTSSEFGKRQTFCTWGESLGSPTGSITVWFEGGRVTSKTFELRESSY
jgi:hypothetical protein